jgi:hypothetical protein
VNARCRIAIARETSLILTDRQCKSSIGGTFSRAEEGRQGAGRRLPSAEEPKKLAPWDSQRLKQVLDTLFPSVLLID